MYLHTGIRDYILLESWVPKTNGAYCGAWLGTFLLGMCYPLIDFIRSRAMVRWLRMIQRSKGWRISEGIHIQRAFFRIIGVSIAYLLMLIIMNFNLGLLLAAILGIGLGSYFFERDSLQYLRKNPNTGKVDDPCCV